MEETLTNPNKPLMVSFLKLPLKAIWFLIKHPIVAIVISLLIFTSSISFLAHYNEGIAHRFNNAMGLFMGATLTSEASEALRSANRRMATSVADINSRDAKIAEQDQLIKRQRGAMARKNKALLDSARVLNENADTLRSAGTLLDKQKTTILDHNNKLKIFRQRGAALEQKATKRFTKVAIYDAAGEFMGWFPIVGDVASVGLAAAGVYEMCQMFKEVESATEELGVKYQVYTDTFCEKPVEKTGEVIAEKTGQIKGKAVAMITVFRDYASHVSIPERASIVGDAQSILDSTYASLRKLYD
jgi:hypothetical protein